MNNNKELSLNSLDHQQQQQPLSFKYLRRTLFLNHKYAPNLNRFKIKRIHIRKLMEIKRDQSHAKQLSKTHQICLKKKLFKGLTHVTIHSLYHQYWLQDLKHSKRLIFFHCEPNENCCPTTSNLAPYVRKINKHLQHLRFITEYRQNIEAIYKQFKRFSQLKTYQGERKILLNHQHFTKQKFQYLDGCLSRLNKLTNYEWNFSKWGQTALHSIMKESSSKYPRVTKLHINLSGFIEEYLQRGEYYQEIHPFFQFNIFPNLHELDLKAEVFPNGIAPSFDSFIKEAFQHLHSLKKLHLKLYSNSRGIYYLFEGLLKIPSQLTSFSLHMNFISNNEWKTLATFLQNQHSLTWLELQVDQISTSKNDKCLENFFTSLSNKPQLQYLLLKSGNWPLEIVSSGLKKLVCSNQLKLLELKTFSQDSSDPESPFEGLCEFLSRNKNTLYSLTLETLLGTKQDFNDQLSKAISQLGQLKVFSWKISLIHKEQSSENHPGLGEILAKLEKLEDLHLEIKANQEDWRQYKDWIMEIWKVLPLLKNLRTLRLSSPDFVFLEDTVEIINSALKSSTRLSFVNLSNNFFKDVELLKNLARINKKRFFCLHLSF